MRTKNEMNKKRENEWETHETQQTENGVKNHEEK